MSVNLKKLLAAGSCCWLLVILCGSNNHVEGATQVPPTVDGILRSVVAVRAQLEPVMKNYLPPRTTQASRMGGLSCKGLLQVPGLQRLFNCVNPNGIRTESVDASPVSPPPAATPFTVEVRVADNLQQKQQLQQQQQQQRRPTVEVIPSNPKATWSTYGIQTAPTTLEKSSKLPYQSDVVRANPLGLIFPSREQINQFQQWQRPYQRPTLPTATTTTPTPRPNKNSIIFPQSEDDRVIGTVRPVQYYTSTAPSATRPGGSIVERFPLETSTLPGVYTTKVGSLEEEGTTAHPEEEEEGLGNRIDSKLLLSLVG